MSLVQEQEIITKSHLYFKYILNEFLILLSYKTTKLKIELPVTTRLESPQQWRKGALPRQNTFPPQQIGLMCICIVIYVLKHPAPSLSVPSPKFEILWRPLLLGISMKLRFFSSTRVTFQVNCWDTIQLEVTINLLVV